MRVLALTLLVACATPATPAPATPAPAAPDPSPAPAPTPAPAPREDAPAPAPELPAPVSVMTTNAGIGAAPEGPPANVATIKRRPIPVGDYSTHSSDYPEEARKLGIGGVMRVKLVVGADGKVRDVRLLNALGHGLDEYALALAKKIVFTPALDSNDQPVASVVVWTFHMTP